MIGDRVLYQNSKVIECWVHDITPQYTILKPCWRTWNHKLYYERNPSKIVKYQRNLKVGQVVKLDHPNHHIVEGVIVELDEKVSVQVLGTRVYLTFDKDSPMFMPTEKTATFANFYPINLEEEENDPWMFGDVLYNDVRARVVDYDAMTQLYLIHSWNGHKYNWVCSSKLKMERANFYVNNPKIHVGTYHIQFQSRYKPQYKDLILREIWHHHTFQQPFLRKILDVQFLAFHHCPQTFQFNDGKERMLELLKCVDMGLVDIIVAQMNGVNPNKSMIEDAFRTKPYFYIEIGSIGDTIELHVFYNNNLHHPKSRNTFHFHTSTIDPIIKGLTNRQPFPLENENTHLKEFWEERFKVDIPDSKHSILFPHQVWALQRMIQMEKTNMANMFDQQVFGKNYNILGGFCNPVESCGGVLALDTGLGKTMCMIHLIKHDPCKTIIVLPLSLIDQWKTEIERHFPIITISEYYGKRKSLKGQIVLTTYGTICNSRNNLKAERVIFDECHMIKSCFSNTAFSCSNIKAKKRWCITATPGAISKMTPIFCLLKINPFYTEHMDRYMNYMIEKQRGMLGQLIDKLFIVLSKKHMINTPITSNMVYEDVILDMSEDHEVMYKHLYHQTKEQIMIFWRENSGLRKYNKIMSAYNRLHMAAMHPKSLDIGIYAKVSEGSKKKSLESMAQSMNQTKFQKNMAKNMKDIDNETCCICLEPFDRPTITTCHHIFCYECIQSSLKHKKKCPQCRQPIHNNSLTELVKEIDMVDNKDVYTFVDNGIDKYIPKNIHTLYQKQHTSNKLEWIKNKIKNTPDQSFVIFSQFNTCLNYVQKHLGMHVGMIDGKKTRVQRKKAIEMFQEKQLKIFLLSTKTSAVGLTLTASCHLIFMEPLLDNQIYKQAIGRLHRIGQHRHVHIYTLYSKNTIEEIEKVKAFREMPEAQLKKSKMEYFISI